MSTPPERKPFKAWFDQEAAAALGRQFAAARPTFDAAAFVQLASADLESLELSGRVRQFSRALRETLPADVGEALDVLTRSLPPRLEGIESTGEGYLQWPLGQFIADYGLEHFDAAMTAMIELTQRFSSEFAVRPFVEQRPEQTFERLRGLTSHANVHVRRWCSEGARPRLPWGKKIAALVADPEPIWPILEALKDDDELYVRRSVANNLNDIAKDHPELVVERCRAWADGAPTPRLWVIRHGLRSLVKAGHPGALSLLGFAPPEGITAKLDLKPPTIHIGDQVVLAAELSSTANQPRKLVVDYRVHFARPTGRASAKVFKWTTATAPPRSALILEKRHRMRSTTVRELYPGLHRIELLVNGVVLATASVQLRQAIARRLRRRMRRAE